MSDEDDTGESTMSTPGLDQIIKMMGEDMPVSRVGILGYKAARSPDIAAATKSGSNKKDLKAIQKDTKIRADNNAEIGAYHEYGTQDLPERSFLRVPIADNLEKYLQNSGALDQDVLKEAMAAKSFVPYMRKIAALAERIVGDAFDSGGFGKWPQLKNGWGKKTNEQILVETQQLRNSITSDVKKAGGSE